jgi:hypothetical protein
MRWLCVAWLCALLCACGGGGGSGGSSTPGPAQQQGSLALALAGGAHPGVDHVWVTISLVALHGDADRPWSGGDASWQVVRLPAPLTVDLAALTNGATSALLTGSALPVGSYAQMRLFVVAHDAPLADSAKSLGLAYNAQVDTSDASGAAQHLPLEFADVALGLRVAGPFVIGAEQSTDLALQWDLERSLVRFASDDGVDRFTMRPDLRWYDLAHTGAIFGVLDKSLFCSGAPRTDCIYDVVASAELPSADGRFKTAVRSTPVIVDTNYALFGLFPLPALPAGGSFDVVIRGRNMQTLVVRAVPIDVADLLTTRPTQLGVDQSDPNNPVVHPIVPVLQASGDASVGLSQPLAERSAHLLFGQTLPGSGELPLEINAANSDPFSGLLAQPLPLPRGPLRVATYTASGPLAFADVTAQEGDGGFSVITRGTRYDDASAPATLSVAGGATSFAAPEPATMSALGSATLSVSLSGGSTQQADAAQLLVSDVGGIVLTRDVSSLIGTGGQISVSLPAGANAAALGGTAVYSVALRTWKRASPQASLQWLRASAPVDLRTATSASVTLTLP